MPELGDRSYQEKWPKLDADLAHPKSVVAPTTTRKVFDSVFGLGMDVAGIGASALYYSSVAPLWWLSKTLAPTRGLPVNKDGTPTRVAIIGAGASGVSAAWTMNQTEGLDFRVYEKEEKIGGHAYSHRYTDKNGKEADIDMGFIFGHHRSYSNMIEIMDKTGSERIDTELSMISDVNGSRYSNNSRASLGPDGVPQPGEMHPDGRAECDRFHTLCERFVDNCAWNLIPFQWFLTTFGFNTEFRDLYLMPILIVLFISEEGLWNYSSRFLFNMFAGKNKFADLRYSSHIWTIKGGAEVWLKKACADFTDKIYTKCPVKAVRRISENGQQKVLVESSRGVEVFDHVIMCTGAKITSLIVKNQTWKEKFLFSQVRYAGAPAYLHTDESFLEPDEKKKRNFLMKIRGEHTELTGDMGRVSGQLPLDPTPILTLDPMREIPEDKIIKQKYCSIHVQDLKHLLLTRALMPAMQGEGNVWYSNSWTTWLGHSGAVDSGIIGAMRLGAVCPLKDPVSLELLEENARDTHGPGFDWRTPVRKTKIQAKL